ncbi:MAG: DNA polymerase [Chthoniobacterales bacterium]
MPLQALFVDFNSYFASVEQQEQPELRGRPVAVVPVMAETTCCIAASYEAKGFGVRTGTRVSDARHMCPELVVIEARPAIYVQYHDRLKEAVDSCIPVEQVLSIDEMWGKLTGKYCQQEEAVAMAKRIKDTIRRNIGTEMLCSIGIAPNRFLAKTASDMQKPDGLIVIREEDLPDCLYTLTLRDFTGIGSRMLLRLHEHGIRTVQSLWSASRKSLAEVWGGIEGERFHSALHGEDMPILQTRRSSIGHSHVLAPELRNRPQALAVLHRLVQKASMRLRRMHYLAGGMHLSVRFTNKTRWSEEIRFTETKETIQLINLLSGLWKKLPKNGAQPLHIGVTLSPLIQEEFSTPSFFENPNQQRLDVVVDALNERYGKNTVYFGGASGALKAAPMRIAFNRIPDIATEGD